MAEEQEYVDGSSSKDKSLYEILSVDKAASQQEIKKAYYKLALCLNPDKNPDDEGKEKFQRLQKIISILGDEEKQAIYDRTGCVDDADLAGEVIQNLQNFSEPCIRRSQRLKLKSLKQTTGALIQRKRLFWCMLCSNPKLDSHQFKDIIDEAISAGDLKSTKASEKWAKHVSKTKPPISPWRRRKKLDKNSEDLCAVIAQRQNKRKGKIDSMFASLVQKYGGGESVPEPGEEEFEDARRRLESRRNSKQK